MKTLKDAIDRGLVLLFSANIEREEIAATVAPHVRDYLAQRFGIALLNAETPEVEHAIKKLWDGI